jgi:very-short-patch-repair endonuclease
MVARYARDLHRLAASLGGVLLVDDLERAGLSRKAVRRMAERGWLVPVRRGAYVVGGQPATDRQLLVAACRLAGPDAVASHWSAARIHDLPVAAKGFEPELTMTGRQERRLQGVRTHIARMPPSQVESIRGLRTTTASRTLVDLAPRLGQTALAKLIDEGLIARHWTIEAVTESLALVSHRPGLDVLRDLTARRVGGPSGSGSALELRVARALGACRPFEMQYQVAAGSQVFVLDIAWPAAMVAVEAEGWHVRSKSRSKFDHERRKFNLLTAQGWRVLHVTADMSDDEIRDAVIPVLLEAARRMQPAPR